MTDHAVCVVVPCMNEAAHVGRLLAAIAEQTPCPREVVFVDGGSTDGTVKTLRALAPQWPGLTLRIIVAPEAWLPTAINLAVRSAAAEVIVRMDAHSAPLPNYFALALAHLGEPSVGVVGGVWRMVPGAATTTAAAIARAGSHPLGAGDAAYRLRTAGGKPSDVDTVPFGCFTRATWARVGGLNERLLGNEDYEFNFRIRQAGLAVRLDPQMQSTYVARSTISALARQYFRYGWCKMQMLRQHPSSWKVRQVVPAGFVATLSVLAVLGLFSPSAATLLMVLLAIYGTTLAGTSALIVAREGGWQRVPALIAAFATIHLCWGSGAMTHLLTFGGWPTRTFLFGRPKRAGH